MSSSRPPHTAPQSAGDPVLGAVIVALTVGSALLVATAGGALSTVGAALLGAVTGFGIAFGAFVGRLRVVLDGSIDG